MGEGARGRGGAQTSGYSMAGYGGFGVVRSIIRLVSVFGFCISERRGEVMLSRYVTYGVGVSCWVMESKLELTVD